MSAATRGTDSTRHMQMNARAVALGVAVALVMLGGAAAQPEQSQKDFPSGLPRVPDPAPEGSIVPSGAPGALPLGPRVPSSPAGLAAFIGPPGTPAALPGSGAPPPGPDLGPPVGPGGGPGSPPPPSRQGTSLAPPGAPGAPPPGPGAPPPPPPNQGASIAPPGSPGAPPGPVGAPPGMPGGPPPAKPKTVTPVTVEVPVNSDVSLVHVGSSDSFAITVEGRQAAGLLLSALEQQDPSKARGDARQASEIYDQIIPRENYGGEYSALQWFADYLVASPNDRPGFLKDPQTNFFFSVYGENNYALLREYLMRKYRLRDIGDEDTRIGQDRKAWLEDTILFNNPRRESWEKTSELMKLLKLKPGQKIADVGSGPGYFTFKFAKIVGPEGQVYAIDTVAAHLRYVETAKLALGFPNVQTIETDGRSLGLAGLHGKVDAIFLCSLYHNIYAMSTQPERDGLVDSFKDALTDDGTLYLVDNGVVPRGVLPYHGPYVAKELVIGQMLNFGFELVEQKQFIPQRYLLVFKKKKVEPGSDQRQRQAGPRRDPLQKGSALPHLHRQR
jgi:SAM-dependent methyltransferase